MIPSTTTPFIITNSVASGSAAAPQSAQTNQSTANPADSLTNPADSLTNEDTFLKLLVAQMQNQDPTSPTDPTQFVGQLTQYSELEQLMQINSGVQTLQGAATGSDPAPVQP